jgi:hypothetical protein
VPVYNLKAKFNIQEEKASEKTFIGAAGEISYRIRRKQCGKHTELSRINF